MDLTQIVSYGGSYREVWDARYQLKIQYENRNLLRLGFRSGAWFPAEGEYPALPSAERFFTQSADAAVAAKRFLASGQTVKNLSSLSPTGKTGPFFAAEFLRTLLDDFGMRLEIVYPYAESALENDPGDTEIEDLNLLAPRCAHLLQLLRDLRHHVPPVLHDIRLKECRNPRGTISAGERLRLAFFAPEDAFESAVVELWGDKLRMEIPMRRDGKIWSAAFDAPAQPAALWYRFRVREPDRAEAWYICSAPDGVHAWLRSEAEEGFRLTCSVPGFETPDWFRKTVLYQIFPDRFAFTDDGTAEAGIAYHRALGQTPDLHASRGEEVRWQPRSFEKNYMPDDFYGGTLRGICEKLPYLRELGVTCLYLNPIVEARSNHRYDTSDYLRVDPILGTNEDFGMLCAAAEQFGIRILCDGVFSHTGADSIYFNRDGHYPGPGACQTEPSPYDSWYDFHHFPDDYRSWWGFRELPEVNETDPAWQGFVVTGENSVVRQWLRRGASGWRLDVADELPDEVLELIRIAAKKEKPDSLVLGEVWEDAVLKESYGSRRRYALGSALDSVMNYPFRTAVLDFLHGRTNAFDLANFLTAQQQHYPKPLYLSLMNLLGSHDVERLRTALASPVCWKNLPREEQLRLEASLTSEDWERADRLERLAMAVQFSVPGVPSVYYGDELGMTGTNDPFNRRPVPDSLLSDRNGTRGSASGWLPKETESLRGWIRQLAGMRASHPALYEGEAFFTACDADVLLILRTTGEDGVLTVVNRSAEEREYLLWTDRERTAGKIAAYSAVQLLKYNDYRMTEQAVTETDQNICPDMEENSCNLR